MPVIDLICNSVKLILAVNAEVCALGQVLAHQAVHVLVEASLPRAVRVAEVHCNAQQLVCKGLYDVGGACKLHSGSLTSMYTTLELMEKPTES